MNSWITVMVGLLLLVATTHALHAAAQPTLRRLCSNQFVYYYRFTDNNSSLVSCMKNVPIERFCIPDEANDSERLELQLTSCSTQSTSMDWIPTRLFQINNQIRSLRIYAPALDLTHSIQSLKTDTFENLQGLVELTLEGFEWIRFVDADVFRPLVSLRKLRLIGFGGQFMTYGQLGDALQGFSNSSLQEITLDNIHTIANKEKVLDLNHLFRSLAGENITSLVLTNTDFNAVTGTLSPVLPFLKYFECSMYWLTYSAMNFGIDSLVFLEHIEEVNYSFIRSWRKRRSSNIDGILAVLDPKIIEYYSTLTLSPNCYFGRIFRIGRKLKRLIVKSMDFFYTMENADVCFDYDRTEIEYFDFFQSPFGTISGSIRGVKKLRYFNLQKTNLNSISHSLFHEMPNLEILLLGGNNIGQFVAADHNGSLFRFQNLSLRSLDLSGCGISWIPQTMFSQLSALRFLNLSRNTIETFKVKLHPSRNLSLLNLSDNSIRLFSADMIFESESLQNSDDNNYGAKLTIDLSRNPLSCLCNATDFVIWLTSTKKVSFENFDEYMCLHPNGSQVIVNRLNVTQLLNDCKSLRQLQTTCPCEEEGLDYKHLRQISLSLTDVYCTYDSKRLSYADLVANTNKTLDEYWWCKENPFYTSPRFIAPLVIGFLVLLLLAIALIVIYKKRYTPSDVARMMQCMDLRPYIVHFIRYLSNHPAAYTNLEFDAFVYFQVDDGPWVRRVLLEKLEHLKVITPDNIILGASMCDAILDGCSKSRVVILVLSTSFKRDNWCREVSLRSYTSHPGSVIPVVISNTDLSQFNDDPLFANLIATHNPIDLSSANSFVWSELIARIEQIIKPSSYASK